MFVFVFLCLAFHLTSCSQGLSVCAQSLNCIRLSVTPQTVAHQAPLSMGFPRQEYRSALPFSSPGEFSGPRDWTRVSRSGRRTLYHWATWETPRSIHVPSLSQLNNIPFFMHHIFWSHSSVDGHLGGFSILAVVNNAAMNMVVPISFFKCSLALHPEVGLLDRLAALFLILQESPSCFS